MEVGGEAPSATRVGLPLSALARNRLSKLMMGLPVFGAGKASRDADGHTYLYRRQLFAFHAYVPGNPGLILPLTFMMR
jgi:hypothetical protein